MITPIIKILPAAVILYDYINKYTFANEAQMACH